MNMSAKSLSFSIDSNQYSLNKAGITELKSLYKSIFGEELTDAEIKQKSSCNDFIIFVLKDSKRKKIGISVLRYFDSYASLWLFGIIDEYRGKGLGQLLLEKTEAFVLASGKTKLRLSTYNIRKEMLSLAIKNSYRIIATDKGRHGDEPKIRLEKTLSPGKCKNKQVLPAKKEVRFLLSVKCNYKCFFCHMEGLDQGIKYKGAGHEEFIDVLGRVIELGYNDVTFTGGEPAISKNILLKAIAYCNSFAPPPAVTIVTNGALWDETLIKAVSSYSGKLKINFSVHSLNQTKYDTITQTTGSYEKAIKNLQTLLSAGVKVKLNCVILKNLNDKPEDLISYIKTAYAMGVFSVKFLELLVTEEAASNFKYFASAESVVIKLLSFGFNEEKKTERAKYFRHHDYPGIEIETVQCTCKVGCAKCSSVRDRTFGPDTLYYPCFVQSQEGLSPGNYDGISNLFAQGDKIIDEYASKYGNDSPILIVQDKFLKKREEVFFETKLSFDECAKILLSAKFKLAKIRTFKLFYCSPINPSNEWKEFRKILKFGYDGHTQNKIDFIFSEHRYFEKDGLLLSEQSFIDNSQPPSCESLEKAKTIMGALDFKVYFEHEFEIHDFLSSNLTISLDISSALVNFKIKFADIVNKDMGEIITKLKAKTINIPFTQWLLSR